MTDCPCCGQSVDLIDKPLHDAARRLVSFNAETSDKLSFAGNLIFELLLRRYPQAVHIDQIIQYVWGERDVDAYNNYGVQLYGMRKDLKRTGAGVGNHRGPAAPGLYWLTL